MGQDEVLAAFPGYSGLLELAMPDDSFVAACFGWNQESNQGEAPFNVEYYG